MVLAAAQGDWGRGDRLGTFLGTLGAFFDRSVLKPEGKRAKADGSLDRRIASMRAPAHALLVQSSGEVAERSLTNVVAVVCGEDR